MCRKLRRGGHGEGEGDTRSGEVTVSPTVSYQFRRHVGVQKRRFRRQRVLLNMPKIHSLALRQTDNPLYPCSHCWVTWSCVNLHVTCFKKTQSCPKEYGRELLMHVGENIHVLHTSHVPNITAKMGGFRGKR